VTLGAPVGHPRTDPREDASCDGSTSKKLRQMEYVGREPRLIPVLGQSRRERGAVKTKSTGAISSC
jgi:hypothetical protein